MSEASRKLARRIFAEAMAATGVEAACNRLLSVRDGKLHVEDRTFDLAAFTGVQIVSLGKAGATLFDAVRSLLPASLSVQSIVSAPSRPRRLAPGDRYFAGGHPLPNIASLQAAEAALAMLSTARSDTLVLYLISGGASAMFEKPLDPRLALPDLIELNRQLVASGASIRQINTVRKHLSAVKGGRLASAAPAATKLTLFVSDVPADALDALASGPTLPDPTTLDQCRAIVDQFLPAAALPPVVRTLLASLTETAETPKPNHPSFRNAHHHILLDNAALLEAASESAQRLGFTVTIDNACDDWDYEEAAAYLVQRAAGLGKQHKRSCLLSGGEVTVRLPAIPGAGGRNQQFALFASQFLDQHPGTTILSAGSDGIDGNSLAAGCVADESTWPRARQAGLHPEDFLAHFDAYPLFSSLGDTIVTGPSGNNLRDLRILLTGADC